ncbi:hypothetical protein DZD18_16940 [Rhodobacteraceae bacterium W635]|uniref:hypothetical protein n=1 Tax=Nioella halotolerans TaxID=2303578 RepID=UPI000E3C6F9B|nr:hypothetical protein DZD18_16940 [Rhodobacteraceae bacterium W635]
MAFFPHPSHFFDSLGITADDLVAGKQVQVDGAVLRELIQMALSATKIDEDGYRRYDDIDKAVEAGAIENVSEHYFLSGYFEGRFAVSADFDSQWYMNTYPDVHYAITNGEIESAKQHYLETGWYEWRAPSAGTVDYVKKWDRLLK